MANRILLLMLTIVVAMAIAACGGGDTAAPTATNAPSESPTDAPAAEEPATATEEAPAAETEAPAAEVPATEEAAAEPMPPGTVMARVSFPQSSARQGPGTNYGPLMPVPNQAEYPVIAQAGEGSNIWYLVDLGDGQLGWLWARVVTLIPEDAVVEPAATIPAAP